MADLTVRQNEKCIIDLPQCGYVFNSARSIFVGYGFSQSKMEVDIIKDIAKEKNFDVFEAGSDFAPGSYAFCTKICSKIIVSQICIIFLNAEYEQNVEKPNANVFMEYGLMLGHNKYVIPFQREGEKLPFNVSGLDTIKYNQSDFKRKAEESISKAIDATMQARGAGREIEQVLTTFLLEKGAIVPSLETKDERDVFYLGNPCGFNLLTDLSGMKYFFFGNFSSLRKEMIIWRVRKLQEILTERSNAVAEKVKLGVASGAQAAIANAFFESIQIWVFASTDNDRAAIYEDQKNTKFPVHVFTVDEVMQQTENV